MVTLNEDDIVLVALFEEIEQGLYKMEGYLTNLRIYLLFLHYIVNPFLDFGSL